MALLDKTQINYIGGVSQLTDVNKIANQLKEQINANVSVKSGGLIKRNSLELFAEVNYLKSNSYVYAIDRTDDEKYVVIIDELGTVLAFDKEGQPFPVFMNDTESKSYLASPNPKTQLKHVVINDTSYIINRQATVSMKSDTTPPNYNRAMVWLKNVDYGKTFEIILNGSVVATHTTPDGDTDEEVQETNTDFVAESLYNQLLAAGLNYTFNIVNGSVILMENNDLNAEWSLETKDGLGGGFLSVIKDTIRTEEELPAQSFQGFFIKVDGDITTTEGDYYYTFEVDGNATKGSGTWTETRAAGIEYKLEEYSMPQKLVSYEDRFELVPVDWFDLLVGDEDTNPLPTFVNKRINDIFLFSNRLGFLSGDSIILSEHDVYTNFFKSSIRATLETDYIDVSASTTELNILRHAVVFNNQLVANSDKNFFSLSFQGANISNSNATLSNFAKYETNPNLKPLKKGTSIYYVNNVNRNSRLYELYVNNYNSADIKEASFVVPEYMPKDLDLFYVNTDNNVFLMNKEGENKVYVYQHIQQDGQNVVNAFSHWEFAEGFEITGIVDIDEDILILGNYKGFTRIYSLSMSETQYDEGFEYHNYLDYKQTEETASIFFNESERRSEITLDNLLNEELMTVVVAEDIGDLVRGETLYCIGSSNNTYYFDKDLSNAKILIGERFNFDFTHGTFYPPNNDGTNRTVGQTQLSTQEIFFEDTGYFEIDIKYKNRRDRVHTIKGGVLGFGVNGSDKLNEQNLFTKSKKYGITNNNIETEIRVRNNSHLPIKVVRSTYVFKYFDQSQGL